MRSSSKGNDPDIKKKYVFFSDPDVIAKRAETSAIVAQAKQASESRPKTAEIPKDAIASQSFQFDLKGLENLLSYHPAHPYPFTFISAVKRKLALNNTPEDSKRTYDSVQKVSAEASSAVLRSSSSQNLYQVVQKMDFVRPLKVPDLKIAPKSLDFSARENSVTKELMSAKFEAPSKEFLHEKVEKPTKNFERIQRKLDFSASDTSSIISTDVIEPLKAPNVSIASSLSKKKEHIRENSREKENRSKRIKKDDSLFGKQDEIVQDVFKRSKSPRHISRKDFGDSASDSTPSTKLKPDRLTLHMPRESDFASTKPKSKNFATSTVKKDDRRHRSFGTRSLKVIRDNSLESKSRTCSNESLSERSMKLPDKVTVRQGSRSMFENAEYKYKDDHHILKQVDEQKNAFPLEARQVKQHKIPSQPSSKTGSAVFKEQVKRIPEKVKPSTSKADGKHYIVNSEESEDIETVSELNAGLRAQQVKTKDSEKIVQSMHGTNITKFSKAIEDSKYTDDSLQQCSSGNMKKDEELFTQSKQSINNESNDMNESVLSEALLDPRRISFRDESRSQPEEFCDLVTPDLNLILRSKRRKQFTQNDTEPDARSSNYNPLMKTDTGEEGIQLLQPTALHKQFQAELHLFDSFNESLRQVMDVEKCLYNVKCSQESEMSIQHNPSNEQRFVKVIENEDEEPSGVNKLYKQTSDKALATDEVLMENYVASQGKTDEFDGNLRKANKPTVTAVEVQTQTVNDIATQTDMRLSRRNTQSRCAEICGIGYDREFSGEIEIPQLSLDSAEQFEDLDQIEEISLPSKLRTMSEISLHETTSSIRTETGTEISISTRDVTCSFNKYLDLEIAQLIQDEKQRYDKIEMLFKSREKTLNDRTKKLVKLEEQKRALRDTGQESRVSSVKKKQRALLLKLQQEKDEMNRLKELHKIASQERKLMLQKQRNMFNPQMSTKNILTKLKRSADSQSPRRLSGPMKGYDIRSNSSMSSLVDSDKSQHDRSQADTRLQISESDLHFSKLDLQKGDSFPTYTEESNASFLRFDKSSEGLQGDIIQAKSMYKSQKEGTKSKYEAKSRKFEEKMPRADILRLRSHQRDVESKLISGHSMSLSGQYRFEKEKASDMPQSLQPSLNKSISEQPKSESDTLVEELSKKSRPSQTTDSHVQTGSFRERESVSRNIAPSSETVEEEISSVNQDTVSKTSKSSQVSEDILQTHSRNSKKSNKSISTEKDVSKKTSYSSESKSSSKRKSSKCQKNKSSFSVLAENVLRSKSSSQMSEDFVNHHNKRTKVDKEFLQSDENDENAALNDTDFNETENLLQDLVKHSKTVRDKSSKMSADGTYERSTQNEDDKGVQNLDNTSTKSQVSTFVSRHSSGDSERNYSKSVVVRSQEQDFKTSKKLEQILSAQEAALASRRNCVEEWMAWHAKLRAEEDRVARMEQAALKLVTASNVFSHDTTVSSDTSDVEGRIEMLTEKLAERRMEMARLKREARKQTKQKLRALEANLINQIKKYDTTIHEMRKKLESKKGVIKDSSKLAIESKSIADFKVPEISLKKIQDIYRSSDLLRSRSESDLLCAKIQPREAVKSVISLKSDNVEDKVCRSSTVQKSERSALETRNTNVSEHLNSGKIDGTNRSIQSIFDECISDQIECEKLGFGSISSISDEAYSDKQIRSGIKAYVDDVRSRQSVVSEIGKTGVSLSRISSSEEIKTNVGSVKSETEIATVSEAKVTQNSAMIQTETEDKSNLDSLAKYSQAKSSPIQSKTEINYSQKLDDLHLNNKNLYENISHLEKELRTLSEFVFRSNEQSRKLMCNEEKSTSVDLTEAILRSDKYEQTDDKQSPKSCKEQETEVDHKTSTSEISEYLRGSGKSKSYNNVSANKSSIEDVDNVMSAIIPEDEVSLSRSNQEIDYEARTKEILNVIEKSIISEHIRTAESDLNRSSVFENNNLVLRKKSSLTNDAVSREADTKSISEAYSKPVSEIEYTSDQAISIQQDATSVQKSKDDESVELRTSPSIVSQPSSSLREQSLGLFTDQNVRVAEPEVAQTVDTEKIISALSQEFMRPLEANDLPTFDNSSIASRTPSSKSYSRTKEPTDIVKEVGKQQTQTESINENCELVYHDTNKTESAAREVFDQKTNNTERYDDEVKQDTFDSVTSLARGVESKEEVRSEDGSVAKVSCDDRQDWTISDSFDVQEKVDNGDWEQTESQHSKSGSDRSFTVFSDTRDASQPINDTHIQNDEENLASDIEDVSMFLPKGESTNIEAYGMRFDETSDFHLEIIHDKHEEVSLTDQGTKDVHTRGTKIQEVEVEDLEAPVCDIKLTKAEKSIEKDTREKDRFLPVNKTQESVETIVNDEKTYSEVHSSKTVEHDEKSERKEPTIEITYTTNVANDINEEGTVTTEALDEAVIDISVHLEVKHDECTSYRKSVKTREIVITELEPGSVEGETLPELEINAKVELADEEPAESYSEEDEGEKIVEKEVQPIGIIRNKLETISEQDSSDGEQLDNLVEVAESGLDMIEKETDFSPRRPLQEALTEHDKEVEEVEKDVVASPVGEKAVDESVATPPQVSPVFNNNTFDILKDPEYEDISEESLEVSGILERNESKKLSGSQKPPATAEKYQVQKSEEVLRILDKIAQKSPTDPEDISERILANSEGKRTVDVSQQAVTEAQEEKSSDSSTDSSRESARIVEAAESQEDVKSAEISAVVQEEAVPEPKDESGEDRQSEKKSEEKAIEKRDQDASSDSSDCGDTPRGVSEIEMDSPRDPSLDVLNDERSINEEGSQAIESKAPREYHGSSPAAGTSEKDIEVMIDKLKASLKQPGVEVPELEAKLLRLQQLEIELEIKRLEAEEVTYYVREIPNKPPPPYTPPGGGVRISTTLASPSPPPAVIVSNVDELTAFTEKATALIYKEKLAGKDITNLEPPPEIYELARENSESMKRDRRIYNTFLFDLCKEIITDVYQSEYERPGPSWTKPNVKTKPIMKIPKNVDELNDYVSKEAATLFGFKTKLQRENMVMRWSRKRRDRVDELLAREAQAEEDEWTKFHHDELAVKNGLTIAILDSLTTETVNEVKIAYAKKRKMMV